MKKNILKVCMMLLAVIVTVACGGRAQEAGNTPDGTQTELKAASKSGKAAKTGKTAKKNKKKKKSVFTPTSAGSAYEILLVGGAEDFRNGAVDSLYAVLSDDVVGVAQSEPCFKVSRINKAGLSKTLRLSTSPRMT